MKALFLAWIVFAQSSYAAYPGTELDEDGGGILLVVIMVAIGFWLKKNDARDKQRAIKRHQDRQP